MYKAGSYRHRLTQISTDGKREFSSLVHGVDLGKISGRLQNVFDTADRDDHPIGAIIQFIANLVDRFIQ
jgi:hypothetical protein